MELHLKLAGSLLILLSLLHLGFPRYFNWKAEFGPVSLINRQMMYIHTFFIAFVVFLMGVLCLACAGDLIHTRLGSRLLAGLALFWSVRLLLQFVGYSSLLWKGRQFETIMHIVFSLLWLYLVWVFWGAYRISGYL